MILAPALAVRFFLGKREAARDADKKAANLIMRANGIGIFSAGLHELLDVPNVAALSVAATMEGLFALYHTGNRCCSEWKDAEGDMRANTLFLPTAWIMFLVQIASILHGDREEDEEKTN